MALGKNARSGKRSSSSSSSYLSTITTVGFVALCVLGVWMLTSSSVIPAQTSHSDGGERLSSSSRFQKSTVPAFEDNDLAVDQDRAMSSLGRKSGLGSLKEDADDDAGNAGKLEYKRSSEEDEDENRRISTGEMDGGDAKPQEVGGHESSTGDDNTSGDKGVATNVVMSEEDQEKVSSTVEGKTQEQTDESAESTQQAEVITEKTEDNTQQLPATEEGNDENQQHQQQQEQEQESSDSQTSASEEIQQQSDQQQAEREQQQPQFPEQEQEPQQSKQQQTESEQEQQQSEQQQTESEQEQQQSKQQQTESEQDQQQSQQQQMESELEQLQSQQQQVEGEQEQQQSHQHSDESEGNQSSNQQSQQQSDSESSDVNQQHLEVGEKDDQQSQQQQVTDESNDQNNHQVEENAASAQNQESQSSEEGTAASQGTQQEEDKLTHPHASGDMIMKQSKTMQPGSAWSTQAGRSENEKERQESSSASIYGHTWELCNVTAGADYIPCLDNEKALKHLHTTGHYEHRERHCPEESPTCLVPLPKGYKRSIEWPKSRDKIWYNNVPHTKLAVVKGHQNWVKVTGEYLTFPGGGTQFIHGALHYVDFIQQSLPKIAWGKRTRVILDVGCGVASFGGFLFERDVLTMSFAPKDEHEAQVQFALERGIPAISAVMGTKRLTFPSRVFDIVHCARCRVPWHADGGTLLLELNRVLRPGGYFVWSATPVYQKLKEDQEIWKAMSSLTAAMCWELVTIKKDRLNSVGAAFYRKPTSNECYDKRKHNKPPMCKDGDDPNAAWYVPLQACMHRVPVDSSERGSQWPKEWPLRLQQPPYWLNNTQVGVYGKPAPADFIADYEHWKRVVSKSYLSGLGISWTNVRNAMDMRAVYGGFAAALNDLKVWVMNVVNVDSPDTLPIIYERGLFGIYHDWCESFSTYPRTYDLLHADHLFSNLKKRCKIVPVMAEVDRIVRPGGKLIVRDESNVVSEVENLLKSLHWEVRLTFSKDKVGILSAQKTDWRPETFSGSS